MTDDIDSIVKGAPVGTPRLKHPPAGPSPTTASGKQGDPLSHAPSSPAMAYLNLLILEASLRAQFLELRARKRHHTFFLALLTLWVAFFGYKLYFAPREDGRGVGGSIYWALEGAQKVCFMGGIITAILVWGTGIWDRGIRWPRRWFAVSNRGLRGFNCKLVVVPRPWWAEALSTLGFFLTYGLFSHTASSSYRHVQPCLLREAEKELQRNGPGQGHPGHHPALVLPPHDDEERGGHEEDLAPGGDYVKLLLLPKPFSPTFRENWEVYRTEYWERENERRALLRRKVKELDRKLAKEAFGWSWWLPWRRTPPERKPTPPRTLGRHPSGDKGRRQHSGSNSSSARRPSVSSLSRSQAQAQAQTQTQAQTPTPTPTPTPAALDVDDGQMTPRRPGDSPSEKRRKKPSLSKARRPGTESRSVTPEAPSPLSKEAATATDAGPAQGSSERALTSPGPGQQPAASHSPSPKRPSMHQT